jgi:hypothetical protein
VRRVSRDPISPIHHQSPTQSITPSPAEIRNLGKKLPRFPAATCIIQPSCCRYPRRRSQYGYERASRAALRPGQEVLEWTATEYRERFLHYVTKSTVKAFLEIFEFSQKRKAFIESVRLPQWAMQWMSNAALEEEVRLRCSETEPNTTHRQCS